MPRRVFEDDLRVQVALVLHDHVAHVTAGVLFAAQRFAFDDVLEADLAADFGENRDAVRIPLAEDVRRLRPSLFSSTMSIGAGGNFVLLELAALGVDERDFAVAGEHDLLAGVVRHDLEPGELDDAAASWP